MQAFYFAFCLILSLLGFGSVALADDDPGCTTCTADCISHCEDYIDFDNPLPDYQMVHCSGHQVPEESRIKTMARMMDWCYCGNELNTNGLEYAGFSNKHEPCNAIEDWYSALGNVTRECGIGNTGFFYDAHRQIAWGFETYQDKSFCDNVRWAK
ncbi:hypothetical protein SLS63_013808 [Diaporthe eres]|uniref:Uncharacterized protein n=1 Tax=Diaporthe eres TaxID=83184 RepID=A0ABR1NMG0_DIAER